MLNLSTALDHNRARRPDSPAIVSDQVALTHRELSDRVQALAAALSDLGVGPGDRVAILLYNHVEFVETIYAVNRLGAAFVPLNYRLSPAEWSYILDHAEVAVLVTERSFAADVERIVDEVPSLTRPIMLGPANPSPWSSYEDLVENRLGTAVPAAPVDADDLQRLMYTSGTTSRPKGVCITHGNVVWKNLAHIVEFGLTADDHTLICGPLYHVGGLDLPGLATLYVGGKLTALRKFEVGSVLQAIETSRPSIVWLAPAMMNALLQSPELAERDTSSLRLIIGGGEKMPEPLIQRIVGAFPSAWFADAYGLTETVSGDTFNDPGHMLSKAGSVGRPVMHLDVRIVDEAGTTLAAGETGEIALRGPKVSPGYWRDEAATARAFRDGWFHTGDIGHLDADGYLYIEDRKKDMIVSGGENIATPEVERVLYEHPDVVEAAVIGVPEERWGEVPKAYVVAASGSARDACELRSFCRERLAKFKVPAHVEFLEELPRTPSGKVLKRALREHGLPPADEAPQ